MHKGGCSNSLKRLNHRGAAHVRPRGPRTKASRTDASGSTKTIKTGWRGGAKLRATSCMTSTLHASRGRPPPLPTGSKTCKHNDAQVFTLVGQRLCTKAVAPTAISAKTTEDMHVCGNEDPNLPKSIRLAGSAANHFSKTVSNLLRQGVLKATG